jgi:hypothetical protein
MFKSKVRSVVVPQSEHGRLAGLLAFHWGNAQYDPPAVPQLAFVEGIALHDRGYGFLDNLPIGEAAEEDWLQVVRSGFAMPSSDPVASLVTRFHLRRLVAAQSTPRRRDLAREMAEAIDRQMAESGLDEHLFARIDSITDFCDSISFDFCFERPTRGEVLVYPRNSSPEPVPLQYELRDGEITMAPWPLSVEAFSGYLVGYLAQGYPDLLSPVLLPYRVAPRSRQAR